MPIETGARRLLFLRYSEFGVRTSAEEHGGGFHGGGYGRGGFGDRSFRGDRFRFARFFGGFYPGYYGSYYPGHYGYGPCYLTVYGTTYCY